MTTDVFVSSMTVGSMPPLPDPPPFDLNGPPLDTPVVPLPVVPTLDAPFVPPPVAPDNGSPLVTADAPPPEARDTYQLPTYLDGQLVDYGNGPDPIPAVAGSSGGGGAYQPFDEV